MKIVLLVAGILLVVFVIVLLSVIRADRMIKRFREIAVPVTGRAVAEKEKRRRNEYTVAGETRIDYTYSKIVTYEYSIDGMTYKTRQEFDKDYPREHVFYYDPGKPRKAYWGHSDIAYQPGIKIASVVLSIVLIIFFGWLYQRIQSS